MQYCTLGSSRYPFNMELAGYFRLEPDRIERHDGRVVNLFQIAELSAYWDPALGEERGTPDWSCCVIVGRDHYGYSYVLDCYLAQYDQPEEQVRAIADLLWRWNVPKCGIEANGFQSLLISDLREAMAQKCLDEQTFDWSCCCPAIALSTPRCSTSQLWVKAG